MGMRVSGNAATTGTQSTGASAWQQRQQSFNSLFSAIQSGNLSDAQSALKTLTGGSSTVNSSSPLASIAQALQSGDIGAAQKAAQQFQTNRASGGHHHHHSATTTAAASTTNTTATSGSAGSILNVVA